MLLVVPKPKIKTSVTAVVPNGSGASMRASSFASVRRRGVGKRPRPLGANRDFYFYAGRTIGSTDDERHAGWVIYAERLPSSKRVSLSKIGLR